MKILNLYAGIGGNRKLWGNDHDITAIEYNEDIAKIYQDFFPNDKVIVTDAHQYLLDHFKEFDFIWSSPPCQSHTRLNTASFAKGSKKYVYPDMALYQQIIFLDKWFYGKYVIENVVPYYDVLIDAQKIGRHLFWSNMILSDFTQISNKYNVANHDKRTVKYLSDYLGYDLSGYNLENKKQVLRNCVNPEIGKAILDKAMNITKEEQTEQLNIF